MKLIRILASATMLAVFLSGCTTTVVTPRPGYGPGYYGHCWVNAYGVRHCN